MSAFPEQSEFNKFILESNMYRMQHPDQRQGQAFMNYLGKVRPDLYAEASEIVDVDPFYANVNVSRFLDWLGEKMS